jgi:Capsule assembly protein Wzi
MLCVAKFDWLVCRLAVALLVAAVQSSGSVSHHGIQKPCDGERASGLSLDPLKDDSSGKNRTGEKRAETGSCPAHSEQKLAAGNGSGFERPAAPHTHPASALGSPYVPLDSWVYAAFDRLSALGYAPSAFANLRPWTRMECARIVASAGDSLDGDIPHLSEAYRLYMALQTEFAADLRRRDGRGTSDIGVDSLYSRYSGITGTPLDDSYHFGQTLLNDFGRPYGQGSNLISGASVPGSAGAVAFYLRGEYQHAAALPAYSEAVQQMIGSIDLTPPQLPIHTTVLNQFRLLEAYASWNFKSMQISAGRQSLWWGPGQGGPPLYSDNAVPMDMVTLTNPSPWKLPSFLSRLGPMRWEFFAGFMAGHHYPANPAIDGQKISFQPTPNLEFGFSRTIVFRPLTLGMFSRGLTSFGDNSSTTPGSAADVGDRRGGFDFSYRVPGLRKWLVVYNDAMTDDDPSPLSAPQRSLMHPGIYLPQIPRMSRLDFRVEAAWSDPPSLSNWRGRFFYYNGAYRDSYTNGGQLLGSWVGREGHGLELWSTYWLSPRGPLQVGYRAAHVDRDFIPAGGSIQDFFARATFRLSPEIEVATFLQYERWTFPVLSPLTGPDTVVSVELTYHPKWRKPLKFQ